MTSVMQKALNDDWLKLPTALKRHYESDTTLERGFLDIEFPWFMPPFLFFLHLIGALFYRRGKSLATTVERTAEGAGSHWHRTITFNNRRQLVFDSDWVCAGDKHVIEYVNAVFGLKMRVHVAGSDLYYEGVCFIARFGSLLIPIPEWLLLGHTTIHERAIDDDRFTMDFRLTHPLLGEIFRYAGEFETHCQRGDDHTGARNESCN